MIFASTPSAHIGYASHAQSQKQNGSIRLNEFRGGPHCIGCVGRINSRGEKSLKGTIESIFCLQFLSYCFLVTPHAPKPQNVPHLISENRTGMRQHNELSEKLMSSWLAIFPITVKNILT